MKFVADENIDRQIVEKLREDGHEVWHVAELSAGIGDHEVLELSNNNQAILLTADKDFGEIVYRQRLVNQGVILVRLAGLPSEVKAAIIARAVGAHSDELAGGFIVITPRTIRIRRPQ